MRSFSAATLLALAAAVFLTAPAHTATTEASPVHNAVGMYGGGHMIGAGGHHGYGSEHSDDYSDHSDDHSDDYGSDDSDGFGFRYPRAVRHRRRLYRRGAPVVAVHHDDDDMYGAYAGGRDHVDVITPSIPYGHGDVMGHVETHMAPGHHGAFMPGFAHPVVDRAHLSMNSFYANEVFAIYSPEKGTCLSLREKDHKEPKLVTARCNLSQRFVLNSHFSFHWLPTGQNNLANLAVMFHGRRLCATSKLTGTYMYPCSEKSIKYSLSAINDEGSFAIRDAGRSSQCMDAEFHHALRMKTCSRHFDDQKWQKIHIAFL